MGLATETVLVQLLIAGNFSIAPYCLMSAGDLFDFPPVLDLWGYVSTLGTYGAIYYKISFLLFIEFNFFQDLILYV
jgi:hypothetical protein